jgi:hypothetical protein
LDRIYLAVVSGGVGFAVLFGLGKMAVDWRRCREDMGKDKAPWERE